MAEDSTTSDYVEVPMLWVGVDEMSVLTSNQLIGQIDQDGIYLTFGMATPPLIMAPTPEEMRAQVERVGYVPVKPIARIAVSRRHLGELIKVLKQTAENFDRQAELGGAQ
jgi:hypothetical protein